MAILLTNGNVYCDRGFQRADLLISEGRSFVFEKPDLRHADRTIDCKGKLIIPGLADVHVHFREPGFSYKETIRTGSAAAAAGGYTCVCTMPNLNPAPSTKEGLQVQLDLIRRDSLIDIVPYGTITADQDGRSRLSDMEALAPFVCAFTDDGRGVQSGARMEEAMRLAKSLHRMIVAHCEDESLLGGRAVHDGVYAKKLGIRGISSESEWRQVERDVELAAKTGCAYHVCHISTKETVEIIRQAKKSGVDVSCETGPHYLVLCDEDLQDLGRFKMNPPIRSADDRDALREGLADGTIDMIATDHAPHSAEEKSRGILDSAFGIVGLETAFPVLYSRLVCRDRLITTEKLIDLMALAPRRRFPLPGGPITDGSRADVTVIDPEASFVINPSDFRSKGKATPFEGWEVQGKVQMTFCAGTPVYEVEQ